LHPFLSSPVVQVFFIDMAVNAFLFSFNCTFPG
jgi:hypothetical protein